VTALARWGIAAVAGLLVVGLLVWARGDEHHHGDDVGSIAPVAVALARSR
jgi:hypothetical protein